MRKRPTICVLCGKKASKNRTISFRGKCNRCATERVEDAITQMAEGNGPVHDRWLRNMAAAFNAELAERDAKAG